MAAEVRLWVDDLASFSLALPDAGRHRACQMQQGIEIRRWKTAFPDLVPHDLVIGRLPATAILHRGNGHSLNQTALDQS